MPNYNLGSLKLELAFLPMVFAQGGHSGNVYFMWE